ncbi:peroxisomal biogenesis factor 6-like, partial [Trifolium medium]|nr:peroxisomal biogenesis factor 6-like [Trifolium medium]
PSKSTSRYFLDEKPFLNSLYKVLVSISETGSVILYIKDVEKIFLRSPRMYSLFQQLLNKLSGSMLVLGSRQYGLKDQFIKIDEKLTMLFPYNIDIKLPQDEAHLKIWKSQLKEATKKTQLKDYTIRVAEVLAANDLDCDDLDTISHTDMMLLSKHTEEIVASATFNHLKDTKNPEYRNGVLILSAKR